MAAPYVRGRYIRNDLHAALLLSAMDGDVDRIKGIISSVGQATGNQATAFSLNENGYGILHGAACHGHLEVRKYLVEELGGDANMIAGTGPTEGLTAFMASAQSDDISTVKYFLEHGGEVMKADAGGRTVLHQ